MDEWDSLIIRIFKDNISFENQIRRLIKIWKMRVGYSQMKDDSVISEVSYYCAILLNNIETIQIPQIHEHLTRPEYMRKDRDWETTLSSFI